VTASADELLPGTRRALAHRVAVGQAEGRTPSLVGAVVRDGRQVWCGSRSMLEGHEPDGDTQYRIGSLTKTFVAVLVMANATSGPDIGAIASELLAIVADQEPRFPDRWAPLPEVDQALLALTGLWYWGPRPYLLRLLAERALELSPAAGRGRASRFRAGPDGTWTGLDGNYRGETLRVGYGSGGRPDHLDLGTFVFTRQPYGPDGADVPLAARPDPDGWRAG
jgi:hypothetical protein